MDELGQLYFDPILEQAQFQKRFENGKDPKTCPKCGCVNSFYARRCVNVIDGERCDYFWTSQICENQVDERTGKILVKGCGAENDVVARVCRCCDVSLVEDRKSTRLNSSHVSISYAVFCLKKNNTHDLCVLALV